LAKIAIVGAALATIPFFRLPPFYESFLYLVLHWVILATSWNILSGYSGYFSFGHGAFFGAGMYTTAALTSRFDVPFLWTLPAAAAIAALMGLALGAVVFRVRRLRGELFALVTLAVTFVVGTIVLNTPLDGGPGVYLSAVPVPKIGPTPASSFYLMALAVAVITLVTARWIYTSRLGTGLFAIHDDEDVAEVMGVPTFRCKMIAFAISCALAGAAGGIHALFVSYVTVGETFTIVVPLTVVLMSVLGGTRHWAGPAVGAAIITSLLYAFTAGDHAVAGKAVFGTVLILVILFLPDGVLGRLVLRQRKLDAALSANIAAPPERLPNIPSGDRDTPLPVAHDVRKAFAACTRSVAPSISRFAEGTPSRPDRTAPASRPSSMSSAATTAPMGARSGSRDETWASGPRMRSLRAGIARTYQIPRPFSHLTTRENVALPAMFGAAALDRDAAECEAARWLRVHRARRKASALPTRSTCINASSSSWRARSRRARGSTAGRGAWD
jgi:branched-chain amino acid transport system permease protein